MVHNIDAMIESMLQRLHTHLIYHVQDPQISGDVQIIATGSEAVLQRDALALRRNEFLLNTANPIDMQIVGMSGRAHLLAEQAKTLGMDPDKIVQDPDTLALQQKMMMQAQMQMAPGAAPGQPGQPTSNTQTTPGMSGDIAAQGGRPAVAGFDRPPSP